MHIGITTGLDYETLRIHCPRDYVQSVRGAGGTPWLLPVFAPGEKAPGAADYLDPLDGLLLSGGEDVDPARFGEEPLPALGPVSPERDEMELALASRALSKRLPILAICRGVQVLNVAAGGSLYQDIGSQLGGVLQHRQRAPRWHPSHTVSVARETALEDILGASRVGVNSLHHQAVKDLGSGFVVAARAPDGIIEAIEAPDLPFAIGVQWHPENMFRTEARMRRLFEAFVSAADRRARSPL